MKNEKINGKAVASDPIAGQFRTTTEYYTLMGDIFSILAKKNMRPFDWAVISRVTGQIAVRQLEAGFQMPESVDHALKIAATIGDKTYNTAKAISSKFTKPGKRTVEIPMNEFEKDIDSAIGARTKDAN